MLIAFDLDDTLFKEIDFVKSAFRAIAREYGDELLPLMTAATSPAAAFDAIPVPVAESLRIYRKHFPDIKLKKEAEQTLKVLRREGHTLAIITDGRSLTQRNKIEALGLDRFVGASDILISEEIGADKITGEPFRLLEKMHPSERSRIYVGDNPAKDFVAANLRGWKTVCLLDSGINIHRQLFDGLGCDFLPNYKINSLSELTDLLKTIKDYSM